MTERRNEHGQPIGPPLPGWRSPPRPPREPIAGRYCRVEPLDPERHAAELYEANSKERTDRAWTYMSAGPFASFEAYRDWMQSACRSDDPLFHAIVDTASGRAIGVASYMRIDPKNGVIEVGNILYSPLLARTRAATEAMYLMMKRAFELGYRRYEWKCDALNAASRAAAQRLGFSFEGIFRQAVVYKERSRDTAWYAVIDRDWLELEKAYLQWLEAGNFDAGGAQRVALSSLTGRSLAARG
ncbi:MAG: GNAT family N-acetyltransferase [Betaproteobacteria bacterium]|nr:GNAT family N-acetyltransferase [Betaproteobacteria bacterium]